MQRLCVRSAAKLAFCGPKRGLRTLSNKSHLSGVSFVSTRSFSSAFAAVDHAREFREAMRSGHGKQLALAELEGVGKDDPAYDPFREEEREEARQRRAAALQAEEKDDVEDEPGDSPYTDTDELEEDDLPSDLGEFDDDILGTIYNNDGSLKRTKSEIAILRAGAPAGGFFAVIEIAGSQHKVTTDDVLIVNRLKPVDTFQVGSTHTLKDVMLVSSTHLTLVGMPFVTGAEVDVMVEEITQDAKVVIFKKRRRKNSDRRNGFRRDVTMLRILDIRPPSEYLDHEYKERRGLMAV
jgi:large subunit ribosomal protein L21